MVNIKDNHGVLQTAGLNPVAEGSMVVSSRFSPVICNVLKGE